MADHRHMRDTNARRFLPTRVRAVAIAGPLAFVTTASAVTLGVLAAGPQAPDLGAIQTTSSDAVMSAVPLSPRTAIVSRGDSRVSVEPSKPSKLELVLSKGQTKKAIAKADRKLWTESDLNLWSQPGAKAKRQGELEAGRRVLVTGRTLFGRDEVVVNGKSRWVTRGYLTDEKPFTLGGACTNGTSVDSGVSPSIVKVHDAVCAEFPEIAIYGALRGGGGDHGSGRAVDIMVSGDRGWQVADFIRKYYAELGVSYVIYAQSIWSVERSGEGWRSMSDRGSSTANHYDHVHVSVF